MRDDEKRLILAALTSQAFADHLGDVRDAERHLWEALGIPAEVPPDHKYADSDSPFHLMWARVDAAGLLDLLPAHAQPDPADDDGDDD